MTKRLALLLLLVCATIGAWAGGEQGEARRIFDEVYDQVFGPKGCSLSYDVNLVGVYKTAGTIWMKGKKSKFTDAKVDSWNDGTNIYYVFKKKKEVHIYKATDEKADKYRSKFKFTLDDFDYSMERDQDGLWILLKQRRGAKGTVKQARALLDPRTHTPKLVKVKVVLFWANINIRNFKAGGISDDIFVFPRSNYGKNYKYVDKR